MIAGLLGVGSGIVLVLFWTLSLTQFPEEILMHMAVAKSLITLFSRHCRQPGPIMRVEPWIRL